MLPSPVERYLSDVQLVDDNVYQVLMALRAAILDVAPEAVEEMRYEGVMYRGQAPFCGIFAYKAHVTIEFSRGAGLADPFGVLMGAGKLRRHIKMLTLEDIQAKHVPAYIAQPWQG